VINNTAQAIVKVVYPFRIGFSIHDVTFINKGN